jgi:mono/diheme cytochrome c family protein
MKIQTLSILLAGSLTVAALLGMRSTPADDPSIIAPTSEMLARGKAMYNIACVACHGLDGTGKGPISGNLVTRPRDFTKGVYKNRTTASGQLPADQDLEHAISIGVHSSMMPGLSRVAPEDRAAIVEYIKSFCARFTDSTEYPLDVLKETMPIVATQESIIKGRAIYLKMQCDNCHGTYGAGNGVSAYIQHDDFGDHVHTTDLTSAADYKFADDVSDVYRIFSTGMNGVAMPSYAGTIGDSDRWHLANYVWNLAHPNE